MGITSLKICDYCGNGCGKDTYSSTAISGNYCTQDCYQNAMIDEYGFGLKGRFNLKTDGHGGVALIPQNDPNLPT